MTSEEFKAAKSINNKELEELHAQKSCLEANVSYNEIDMNCIKTDFLQYLFSPNILPEIIHRFIPG